MFRESQAARQLAASPVTGGVFAAGASAAKHTPVAGGGTFLSFGTLTLAGVPPVVANATSSITQFPGYVTSTLAYWNDFKIFWRGALWLALASVIGSLAGAWILLQLDNPSFRALVPWLEPVRGAA